jgi:hypothetical protein
MFRRVMARYRGGDGHYADVECAYAELERYLVLSCKVVEDGEACRSQRGARSLSAFCGGRDGRYADCVFAFANSVLIAPACSKKKATQVGWPS